MGNRMEAPYCLVEQAVNAALTQAFEDTKAVLLARLGDVTLEALRVDLQNLLAARKCGRTRR